MALFAQIPHELQDQQPPAMALALYASLHRFSVYSTGIGEASRVQLMGCAGISDTHAYYRARRWLVERGWVAFIDTRGGRKRGAVYQLQTTPGSTHPARPDPHTLRSPDPHTLGSPDPHTAPPPDPHTLGSPDPHTTTENPSETENPPEGWGAVATMLAGRGLAVGGMNGRAPRLVRQLVSVGWRAADLVEAVWSRDGLDLPAADRPGALLAHRLEQLDGVTPPSTVREQRERAEVERLAALEREDQDDQRRRAEALEVWEAMTEPDRQRFIDKAVAQLGLPPRKAGYRKSNAALQLARTLALQERGLEGAHVSRELADRLAQR